MALPRDSQGHVLLVPLLAALFGFTTQVPNPVFVNLTNKFGIQLSVPITLYVIWRFRARIPPNIWRTFGLLLIPLFVSIVAASGTASEFSALYKNSLFSAIALLPLLAAGFLANESAAYFLRGTAWAILLHIAVGLLQVLAGLGKIPFDIFYHLYNNGEYATDAETIPLMLKTVRPFGLFPEPSAMTACISPFVVLFVGYSIGLIGFPGEFDRGCRRLIMAAAITGAIFVVISRSGGSMFLAASIVFMFFARALKEPDKARRTVLTVVPLAFGIASAAVLIIGRMLGGAASGALNGSWAIRGGSIAVAVRDYVNAPLRVVLFGFAGTAITNVRAESNFPQISSVLLTYLTNGGLVAFACVGRIAMDVADRFRAASCPPVAIGYLVAYLSGIGLATSYATPAPLYTALSVMLVWHRIVIPLRAGEPTTNQTDNSGDRRPGLFLKPI